MCEITISRNHRYVEFSPNGRDQRVKPVEERLFGADFGCDLTGKSGSVFVDSVCFGPPKSAPNAVDIALRDVARANDHLGVGRDRDYPLFGVATVGLVERFGCWIAAEIADTNRVS